MVVTGYPSRPGQIPLWAGTTHAGPKHLESKPAREAFGGGLGFSLRYPRAGQHPEGTSELITRSRFQSLNRVPRDLGWRCVNTRQPFKPSPMRGLVVSDDTIHCQQDGIQFSAAKFAPVMHQWPMGEGGSVCGVAHSTHDHTRLSHSPLHISSGYGSPPPPPYSGPVTKP